MIIFDLDGTLADCQHRRHFVDRHHSINEKKRLSEISIESGGEPDPNQYVWKPDWKAFYEACNEDKPIHETIRVFRSLSQYENVLIWSGRCESVREKTIDWLYENIPNFAPKIVWNQLVKMRQTGDSTPDDYLKERWLNERCSDLITAKIEGKNPVRHDIDFVFDDRPKVVRMWRRRGIFVFNCCQHDMDF